MKNITKKTAAKDPKGFYVRNPSLCPDMQKKRPQNNGDISRFISEGNPNTGEKIKGQR